MTQNRIPEFDIKKYSYSSMGLSALNKEQTDWADEYTKQWAKDINLSICFDKDGKIIITSPFKYDPHFKFFLVKREKGLNEEQELEEFINRYKDDPSDVEIPFTTPSNQ